MPPDASSRLAQAIEVGVALLLVCGGWLLSVQHKPGFDRLSWQPAVLALRSFVLNVTVVLERRVEAIVGASCHELLVVFMESRSALSDSDDPSC
jgi:hypothetical protein